MEINREIQGLPKISASRLKVFKTCQRQHYYKYTLHYNDRPDENTDQNVAGLLGSALHKAIEAKYKDNTKPTIVFQEYMNNKLEEWENKGYKINALDYFPRAMKVGKQILNDFPWTLFTPMKDGIEVNFTLPFPNKENAIVNINGIIDMITTQGDVIDHKSATKAPSQDILNGDVQLFIYTWAYEQIYGKMPRKIIWHHLRVSKLIEYSVNDYDFKLSQLALDIEALINTTHHARRDIDSVCLTKCAFYELCYGPRNKDIVVEDTSL